MAIGDSTVVGRTGVRVDAGRGSLAQPLPEGAARVMLPEAPHGFWGRLVAAFTPPARLGGDRPMEEVRADSSADSCRVGGQTIGFRACLVGFVKTLRSVSGEEMADLGANGVGMSATQPNRDKIDEAALQAHQSMVVLTRAQDEIAMIFASAGALPDPAGSDAPAHDSTAPYPMPVTRLSPEKMQKVIQLQQELDRSWRAANALTETRNPVARLISEAVRPDGLKIRKALHNETLLAELRTSALAGLDGLWHAMVPRALRMKFWQPGLPHGQAMRLIDQMAWRFARLIRESADVRSAFGGDWVFANLAARARYIATMVKPLRLADADKNLLETRLMAVIGNELPTAASVASIREVGRGCFGVVSLGTFGDRPVAIKRMMLPEREANSDIDLIHELAVQGHLRDPNIPKVLGVYVVDDTPHIVMEQIKGGNLASFFDKHEAALSSPERAKLALHLFAGTAHALDAMGRGGLVHHDVKPANIMLDTDSLQAKLIDFGTAGPGRAGQFNGTPIYASPEQFDKKAVLTPQSDIYSLGSTLYDMVGGTLLAAVDDPDRSPDAVGSGDFNELRGDHPVWSEASRPVRRLIEACWARDPLARPSTAQLLQALRGGPVAAAPEGQPGLKAEHLAALDVLRPEHPLRQHPEDIFQRVLEG